MSLVGWKFSLLGILVSWLTLVELYGQSPIPIVEFNFNDQHFNEKEGKIVIKPIGAKLVKDRFDNPRSALFLEGTPFSYLNLGNSPLLKNNPISISLWVIIERKVYAGRGYEGNLQ